MGKQRRPRQGSMRQNGHAQDSCCWYDEVDGKGRREEKGGDAVDIGGIVDIAVDMVLADAASGKKD